MLSFTIKNRKDDFMAKLVAFYSRADENYFRGAMRYIKVGNTEKIAGMIADATGADLFKIEQKVPYAADYNTCIEQAKKDLQENVRPELANNLESIDDYDEIYIGFPNYWGTMPMAVFTFLEQFDWAGKKIYPFVTHEGSGFGKCESDLKRICKDSSIQPGFSIQGSMVEDAKAEVDIWIKGNR